MQKKSLRLRRLFIKEGKEATAVDNQIFSEVRKKSVQKQLDAEKKEQIYNSKREQNSLRGIEQNRCLERPPFVEIQQCMHKCV